MKRLLLLRHAKSSWDDPTLADHDRPLNKRGKHAAPRMGRLLADEDLVPDLIIASSAKRARKTADKVARACGYHGVIEQAPPLYLNGPEAYLEAAATVAESVKSLMLVGHNPDSEALIRMLCGRVERMPTAALAWIDLPIDTWPAIMNIRGNATLVNLWRPRDLPPAQ